MRNAGEKVLILILLISMLLPVLFGCGGEKTREQILTKTIHDFDGFVVENLDEQEDTNFIVYAKGVKEIEMTDQHNVLISADEGKMDYTFDRANEMLKSMQPGDVFYADASTQNPQGVVIKVKTVNVWGDVVQIQGEEYALQELFEYVDIAMEIDASKILLDESTIPADCTVTYGESPTIAQQSSFPGYQAAAASLSASSGESGVHLDMLDNFKAEVPVGFNFGVSLSRNEGGISLMGNLNYTVQSVYVEFGFSWKPMYFHSTIKMKTRDTVSLMISGETALVEHDKPLAGFVVPVGGPVIAKVYPSVYVAVKGKVSAGIKSVQDHQLGVTFTATEDGCSGHPISETPGPQVIPVLEEFSGTVTAGMKFKATIGIFSVADIYTSVFGGLELEGKYDVFETAAEATDSIHDCRACIDGDGNLVFDISLGAEVGVIPGKKIKMAEAKLLDIEQRCSDFYISFGRKEGDPVEADWNRTCPHKRYRATVTVLDEEGNLAGGASVKAQYYDGREDTSTTDDSGEVVFYLPAGDNLVTASRGGEKGNVHVVVGEKPVTAILRMEDKQQLFICYRFFDSDVGLTSYANFDFTEVQNILQMNYPNAVYVHIDEWMAHIENSPNANLVFTNYTAEGLSETYGIAEGDVILFVQSNPGKYGVRGYYDLHAWVGVFLLPEIEEEYAEPTDETMLVEETMPREDIPYMIEVYQGSFLTNYDWDIHSITTDVYYRNEENIWQGLRIDENYRILDAGTEWIKTEWKDPAPGAGMSTESFCNNFSMHHNNLSNYIFRVFPYIDRLVNGQWEGMTEETTTEQSVEIINGQTNE